MTVVAPPGELIRHLYVDLQLHPPAVALAPAASPI
jgi:hypothetical protein